MALGHLLHVRLGHAVVLLEVSVPGRVEILELQIVRHLRYTCRNQLVVSDGIRPVSVKKQKESGRACSHQDRGLTTWCASQRQPVNTQNIILVTMQLYLITEAQAFFDISGNESLECSSHKTTPSKPFLACANDKVPPDVKWTRSSESNSVKFSFFRSGTAFATFFCDKR